MNERERVLDLVKQGIISTEEAIVLLESMATEKNDTEITQDAPTDKQPTKQTIDLDEKRLEKVLDELATKATQTSAELDGVNAELATVTAELAKSERALTDMADESDDVETDEETVALQAKLTEQVSTLTAQKAALEEKKADLEAELSSVKENRKEKRQGLNDDWREQTSEALQQVGSTLGGIFKKTWSSVYQAVQENVDWKEVSFKVPGVSEKKLTHTFTYPENTASIIDIKVANGTVVLEPWAESDVKIEAKIKLFGKMEEASELEAFLARSQIEVDDEKMIIHLPSKRMSSQLKIYVPARTYDYISFKMLNGDVKVKNINVNDMYAKSTNGDLVFKGATVTLLELEGINGEMKVQDSAIHDLIASSLNGNVQLRDAAQHSAVSLVNGDIRYTAVKKIPAKVVLKTENGTLKVAMPANVGIEAETTTIFGSIKNRLSETEVIREKRETTSKVMQFRRENAEQMVALQLRTTAGSIYLKDTDVPQNASEATTNAASETE